MNASWLLCSSQMLKSHRIGSNHMAQRIEEQIGAVSTVKPERHFVQIGLQMLRANSVPCSNDAPLEQRECGFYGVGMNVRPEPDVLFAGVFDRLMLDSAHSLAVRGQFVSDDHVNVAADVFLDVPRQSSSLGIFRMKEADSAPT